MRLRPPPRSFLKSATKPSWAGNDRCAHRYDSLGRVYAPGWIPLQFGKVLRHCVSPDGASCVVADLEGDTILRLDLKTRRVIGKLTAPKWVANPEVAVLQFSPSGAYLLASAMGGDSHKLEVWDVASARRIFVGRECRRFAISPDDRLLAVNDSSARLRIIPLNDQSSVQQYDLDDVSQHFSFSPDGQRLAICFGSDGRLFLSGRSSDRRSCDWTRN